jgi:chromosome segregation ATPase
MENSQLTHMVTWLNQERQRDRTDIDQLRQRVEQLTDERDHTTLRAGELEAGLATIQTRVERLAQLEDYFERFKQQVGAVLESGEAQREQSLRESDRLRHAEIANVTRLISEFRKDLDKFRRYDEELVARRVEAQRMAADLTRLQQSAAETATQLSEWVKSTTMLEEQRRQDTRRVTDLQTQADELFKRVEAAMPRIQYLEGIAPRLGELKIVVEELRQTQGKDLEKHQFLEAQIERQVRQWSEEIETYRQRMDGHERRMEQYGEYLQVIKQATEGLQALREQVERELHEASELQRLAQNRQKTQFEDWQTQQEQRWQKYTADWDRQWGDYDRTISNLGDRIGALETQVATLEKHMQLLIRIAEEDAQLRAMAAHDWQSHFEQTMEDEA